MKSTDKPSLIETVIASGAKASYVRTIPKTQTKSGSGEMSLDLGWPPECAIPVAAGGKYPQMADANGVLNLLSAAVQQLQARFFGPYNADFATAIGGYPLNAIVSDTKAGQFWVSTAEDNTTVPGDDGASWQSLFAGYATNEALKTETTNRANADTNLQNQINNRVLKSGDTMSGPLLVSKHNVGGSIHYSDSLGTRIDGYYINNSGVPSTSGVEYEFDMWMEVNPGVQTYGVLRAWTWAGERRWTFTEDGYINTPIGTVALTSEIPTSGVISGGTYTKVPLNDGTGRSVLTQRFTVSGIHSGSIVTIPMALSSNPVSIVVAPNTNYNTGSDPSTGNWSSSQFSFYNAGDTAPSYSFIVEGVVS